MMPTSDFPEQMRGKESSCYHRLKMSCPPMKRGDDVIERVIKRLPSDHPIAKRPELAGRKNFICTSPGMPTSKFVSNLR